MTSFRSLLKLQLILLGVALRAGVAQGSGGNESSALLALRSGLRNWDASVAALPGAAWAQGTVPCGSGGAGSTAAAWKGVNCSSNGTVTAVVLSGLGLNGTLPAALPTLPTLALLDLSSNRLSGTLPPGWGAALPALASMLLQGNNLSGSVPMPGWTSGTVAGPAIVTLEPLPGNAGLCGPVVPLDPVVFPPGTAGAGADGLSDVNLLRTGSNTTSLELVQRGLFLPGTAVTLTNWLGSCMEPCSSLPGWPDTPPANVAAAGLPWPPVIKTNVFDLGWSFNMSMADLVRLNPKVAYSVPRDALALPCYPAAAGGRAPGQGLQELVHYGGDSATGKFAGGNQLPGPEGLAGAMAAARVVGRLPQLQSPEDAGAYSGSLGPGGAVVEPVFWFVDLGAKFSVSVVQIAAGPEGMRNASVYVGNDATSVFGNALVKSGLSIEAGQHALVEPGGAPGRYVVVYTGRADEGRMSLRGVEVYTLESNAMPNMPVTASYMLDINRGGAGPILQALVDNNASTCVQLRPDPSTSPGENNTAWAFVDLGYFGAITAVAALPGPRMTGGASARIYVTQSYDELPSDANACSTTHHALRPSKWEAGTCNQTGRFVHILVSTPSASDVVDLCELQAWLTDRPTGSLGSYRRAAAAAGGGGGSGLSGGAVAGVAVGSLAAAALLAIAATYARFRRRWLVQQDRLDDVHSKGGLGDGWAKEEEEGGGRGGHGSGGGAYAGNAMENGAAGGGAKGGEDGAAGAAGAAAGLRRRRISERVLFREFFKTLAHSQAPNISRQESELYGPSIFSVAAKGRPSSAFDAGSAATDFTKLPSAANEVSPSEIQLIELVGGGSFGEVWLALYCGAFVAVKIIAKVRSDNLTSSMQQQIAVRNLRKEALLMSKLRHPNVCLYLGACMDPPCLLFEYCAKSSLDRLLAAGRDNPQASKRLNWVRLLSMALDAAKGMLYLHTRSPPIAHRDLKSANLLVDSQWRVKVADFSLSRAMETGNRAAMLTVVTTNPRFLPPEVLGGLPGQLPADVWGFGCVMWELATWRLPYQDLNTFQIIALVQSQGAAGLRVPPPHELLGGAFYMYQEYVELMTACWAREPADRPHFDAIVQQLGLLLTEEVRLQQGATAANGGGGHFTESGGLALPSRAPSTERAASGAS